MKSIQNYDSLSPQSPRFGGDCLMGRFAVSSCKGQGMARQGSHNWVELPLLAVRDKGGIGISDAIRCIQTVGHSRNRRDIRPVGDTEYAVGIAFRE